MKAILIKSTVQYRLLNEDGIVIATSFYNGKLSLKNCQAIERGYDLDELADEFSRKFPNDSEPIRYASFIIGFQKALSILGDKKFSEKDAKRLFELGIEHGHRDGYVGLNYTNKCIHSLQQTEWDVSCNPDVKDADGNLILKRK